MRNRGSVGRSYEGLEEVEQEVYISWRSWARSTDALEEVGQEVKMVQRKLGKKFRLVV